MDIRLLKPSDYEKSLVKWWKSWRFPVPPRDMLPGDGLSGLMVSEEDVDICAGFVYFTNSKAAWAEYIVSNFEVKDREKRDRALKILIESLCKIAKDQKFKYVYVSLKSQPLINKYEECGFMKGSENCTEMIKVL